MKNLRTTAALILAAALAACGKAPSATPVEGSERILATPAPTQEAELPMFDAEGNEVDAEAAAAIREQTRQQDAEVEPEYGAPTADQPPAE